MSGPGDRASKRSTLGEPTVYVHPEGHVVAAIDAETAATIPPGCWSSARTYMPHARKSGDLDGVVSQDQGEAGAREGGSRNPLSQAVEESDEGIVAKKAPKAEVTLDEVLERRPEADGKIRLAKRSPDTAPASCAHAPERIGQRARKQQGEKFTNLLSHLRVPLLREAYQRLRREAAVGVDKVSWQAYGEDLDARLQSLEDRLHRGSYHPQPVRRVYLEKGDGRRRPLGIPSLEDKIAQQGARMLMEPVYESVFRGFSYGFRPGRSAHGALNALAVALSERKVNWVLEADIRGFFDAIDHGWLRQMLEHRIGDTRLMRLLMKWLQAVSARADVVGAGRIDVVRTL